MKKVLWLLLLSALAIGPAAALPQALGYDPSYVSIDGNVTVDGGACVPAGPPGSDCTDWLAKQQNNKLVGILDGLANADQDILSPGSNLNPGSTLPKEDITRVWISNNTEYLYIAEERRANNGNSAYHLFMTRAEPTCIQGQPVVYHLQNGDLEVQICFPKGSDPSGKSIVVRMVTGVTGIVDVEAANIWASGIFQPDPLAVVAAFEINTAPTAALDGAFDSKGKPTTSYDTACFAEAAISLASLGLDPCGSTAYASVITRSSCSLTSDVKDFAGPLFYSFGGPNVSVGSTSDCANNYCFTATASLGTPPYLFDWYLDGAPVTGGPVNPPDPAKSQFSRVLAAGAHTVRLVVTDSAGCSVESTSGTFTVLPLLTIALDWQATCPGAVTLTAKPAGGNGGYSYAWTVDGVAVPGSGSTLQYGPDADCTDHRVCVTVTDGRGCTAAAYKTFNQSVSTSAK